MCRSPGSKIARLVEASLLVVLCFADVVYAGSPGISPDARLSASLGASAEPSVAIGGDGCISVAWTETTRNYGRTVYLKHWSGSEWIEFRL